MIRWITLFLCVWIIGIMTSMGQSSDEAGDAYLRGDFARAIELYEGVIQNNRYGEVSYSVYFNLGHAYSQMGNWGKAMVNYQRAYRLNPRDGDIITRINTIRTLRPNGFSDETRLWTQITQLTGLFTLWELELIALLIWSITWVLGMIWWRYQPYRHYFRYPLVMMIIITIIVVSLTVSRVHHDSSRPLAVVTSPTTDVLSGAGIDYLTMFRLSDGAEVRILEQSGIWVKIELPDGRMGWVRISTIEII